MVEARLLQLQRETLAVLERIDGAAYVIEPDDAAPVGTGISTPVRAKGRSWS